MTDIPFLIDDPDSSAEKTSWWITTCFVNLSTFEHEFHQRCTREEVTQMT